MKVTIDTDEKTVQIHGNAPMEEVKSLVDVITEAYKWDPSAVMVSVQKIAPSNAIEYHPGYPGVYSFQVTPGIAFVGCDTGKKWVELPPIEALKK